MSVLSVFEGVLGIRSRHPAPPSSNLAARSRRSTRDPVKMEPPGPKFKMILMDDIDHATGRLSPDYLERREARKKEAARPARGAVVIEGDFNPK